MNFLKNLATWMQFIPAILAAVKMIEEVAPIPGAGKAKLDLILQLVAAFYAQFGQAKDAPPQAKVQALVTDAVSSTVGFLNGVGVFKTQPPPLTAATVLAGSITLPPDAALPHAG